MNGTYPRTSLAERSPRGKYSVSPGAGSAKITILSPDRQTSAGILLRLTFDTTVPQETPLFHPYSL
jgi:hypothetical protein